MCWKGTLKEAEHPIVADCDITVYKVGFVYGVSKFRSLHHKDCFYYKNKEAEAINLVKHSTPDGFLINCGYHCFSEDLGVSIKAHKDFRIFSHFTDDGLSKIFIFKIKNDIGKFIIPKGSYYYKNNYGEIVSNRIKYSKHINIPNNIDVGKCPLSNLKANK